jgi:hypothetical protein
MGYRSEVLAPTTNLSLFVLLMYRTVYITGDRSSKGLAETGRMRIKKTTERGREKKGRR